MLWKRIAGSEMADPGPTEPVKMPVQTRPAVARKHLRRDQEVAKKKGKAAVGWDSAKEKLVSA